MTSLSHVLQPSYVILHPHVVTQTQPMKEVFGFEAQEIRSTNAGTEVSPDYAGISDKESPADSAHETGNDDFSWAFRLPDREVTTQAG
ncbi:hypothetical protein DL769_008285 [Monosporascus sp. CRB-8-3]|nr:hypothetical protein DL769_008285 [Monosporascus sp. CRB-8-3]